MVHISQNVPADDEGCEDEPQIDGDDQEDATDTEESASENDDKMGSNKSDSEADENCRTTVQSKKSNKMVICSDDEDKSEEEHTSLVNPVSYVNLQQPSSSNHPISDLQIEIGLDEGANDVVADEIRADLDVAIAATDSECAPPAIDPPATNEAPDTVDEPPVAGSLDRRSTQTRKRILMNACECRHEVANEDRMGDSCETVWVWHMIC